MPPKIILTSLALCCSVSTAFTKGSQDFTKSLLDEKIWETPIAQFAKDNSAFKFRWMSSSKNRLRSLGSHTTTFGSGSGELLVVSNKDKVVSAISVSFYNRGDNAPISTNDFNALYKRVADKITATTQSRPEDKSSKGTVALTKTFWRYNDTAFQLEKSFSKSNNSPEFIRLRVASLKSSRSAAKTVNRSMLKRNVIKDKNGDIFIGNVPMVDQGQKGYCVCASAARVYQYYGRETDQHEIAQLAGSTASSGTQINEMVASLKKVTGKLNSRIVILYEYPKGIANLPTQSDHDKGKVNDNDYRKILIGLKEMKADVNAYQQLAKKKKAKSVKGGGRYTRFGRDFQMSFDVMEKFRAQCDPKVYREVMMNKSSYKRFHSKIKEYINQGVPVAWTLKLGMFPEPEIPQASGGHMRLIIGYNEKEGTIIYSDSWGAGHEKKYMDAGEAFCMTTCLLAMPPTR